MTPDAPLAVHVLQLSHTYPKAAAPALEGVSFDVNVGEVFGILGPNGGGKTTLFRLLSTMLAPSGAGGEISVFGHDPRRQPHGVRSVLGVVFQSPSLDNKLTALENLTHHGRLYGLSGAAIREAAPAWLGRLGLRGREHAIVEKLSGGMRRRVEIAKAMLTGPRLLLMDEPATGLDPGARRDLWDVLAMLRRDHGVTVMLTTHLMDEAERCDRLAILAAGKLVAVGRPSELKATIGGDVVSVEVSGDEQAIAAGITERFGPWTADAAPRVVDGVVRFERRDGAAAVAAIAAAWPEQVRRVSVGQPTLEDVFLDRTGHAFWGRSEEPALPPMHTDSHR